MTSLSIASDGGYLLGGWETYDGAYGSYEIKKLAVDGTLLWEDTIGPNNNIAWLNEFQETPDGGYILAGSSSARAGGDQSRSADGADYWIVKLNTAREVEWDRLLTTLDLPPVENGQESYSEELKSIVQTTDGGYLVGGISGSSAGDNKTEATRGPKMHCRWFQSFNARKENNTALLTWETISQFNSDHFEVQHSADGKSWNNLTSINAAGESTRSNLYHYAHTASVSGDNYYRLKRAGILGSVGIFKPLGVPQQPCKKIICFEQYPVCFVI